MKIENLKDLKNLLKVCQENGVDAIKIDGIEMSIRLQTKSTRPTRTPSEVFQPTLDEQIKVPVPKAFQETEAAPDIETPDELTPDQLLNWSSGANQ